MLIDLVIDGVKYSSKDLRKRSLLQRKETINAW